VAATTISPTTGHALGELADTDHPHRSCSAPRLQPAADVAAQRWKAPRRGAELTLLVPTFTRRRHRQKYPAMSSWDHAGWRTGGFGANSVM
jgi:hypothetical protein